MPLQDNSVDAHICFHVLEHIKEDRAAIAELYRTLKPGGVAYIMAPINLDFAETQFFGYPNPDYYDHYWAPGRDYHSHLVFLTDVLSLRPRIFRRPRRCTCMALRLRKLFMFAINPVGTCQDVSKGQCMESQG